MKIKQYNFIRGSAASGKTLFTQKLVHCLGNKTIYYNLDGSLLDSANDPYHNKMITIDMQDVTFYKILKDIKLFNENLYEMWNIVIDPITLLSSKKDDFFIFVQSLPKNHRYFFTSQLNRNTHLLNLSEICDTLESYKNSFLLPDNSISVFDIIKKYDNISVFNYNTNKAYNLGDVPQIIRDIKINEILDVH